MAPNSVPRCGRHVSAPLSAVWRRRWFPTSCRSLALGIGAAAGRVGVIVCPLLVDGVASAGYLVVGIVCAACAACTLLLKEMRGEELADVA